jgi:hypothetical protein
MSRGLTWPASNHWPGSSVDMLGMLGAAELETDEPGREVVLRLPLPTEAAWLCRSCAGVPMETSVGPRYCGGAAGSGRAGGPRRFCQPLFTHFSPVSQPAWEIVLLT